MAADGGAQEFAPAKINLTLHVTGRRSDGYHLLDSLVVFAGVGDVVAVGGTAPLSVEGKFGVEAGPDNLVLKAAALFGPDAPPLHLQKNLPVAGGLGGGSADAAATLRLLARVMGSRLPVEQAPALGADVPVCLVPEPQRMRGIGESLEPVAGLPAFWFVLANPGVMVRTEQVFRSLALAETGPMDWRAWRGLAGFADFLKAQRNDLQATAITLAPPIAGVLAALEAQPGCLLARMTGSGATCFGVFAREAEAQRAAGAIGAGQPGWWVVAARRL